jgi:hypothetical protein
MAFSSLNIIGCKSLRFPWNHLPSHAAHLARLVFFHEFVYYEFEIVSNHLTRVLTTHSWSILEECLTVLRAGSHLGWPQLFHFPFASFWLQI